jgi:hypothetical protein
MEMKLLLFTGRTDMNMPAHLCAAAMRERPDRTPFGVIQGWLSGPVRRKKPAQGLNDRCGHPVFF